MAPSCFALQVPDVRGLQVPVGTRLRTALVSLKRSRFHAHFLLGQNRYGHGRTSRSGSYGPGICSRHSSQKDQGVIGNESSVDVRMCH